MDRNLFSTGSSTWLGWNWHMSLCSWMRFTLIYLSQRRDRRRVIALMTFAVYAKVTIWASFSFLKCNLFLSLKMHEVWKRWPHWRLIHTPPDVVVRQIVQQMHFVFLHSLQLFMSLGLINSPASAYISSTDWIGESVSLFAMYFVIVSVKNAFLILNVVNEPNQYLQI